MVFNRYGAVYDKLYYDKDYREEVQKLNRLVKGYGRLKGSSLLSIGCGTGRHDIELADNGYTVHGIDISLQMIEKAKKRAEGRTITYEVADARSYTADKQYDIAVSLFHVMSYQTSNDDIISCFQTVSNALKKDGIFIFDVWYGPGVLRDLPGIRVKRAEDENAEIIRIARPCIYPEKNIVDVNYDLLLIDKASSKKEEFKEIHSMRYFFTPEIEMYLKLAGLRLEACIDCRTLDRVSFDTWTAYFIALKD